MEVFPTSVVILDYNTDHNSLSSYSGEFGVLDMCVVLCRRCLSSGKVLLPLSRPGLVVAIMACEYSDEKSPRIAGAF